MYFLLISLLLTVGTNAQDVNLANSTTPIRKDTVQKITDGYYRNTDIEGRKVVEYPPLRQADVVYRRRIWREIDLRDKMNLIFASPKARLIDIIVQAIQSGEMKAYDPTPTKNNPTGDNFELMEVLAIDQVLARLGGDSILVEEFNENNEVIGSRFENRSFNSDQVIKFRIKEDWIFDKQRSVFEPRIVGIAPLIIPNIGGIDNTVYSIDSPADPFAPVAEQETPSHPLSQVNIAGQGPLQIDPIPVFWIYFPEARHVLVNKEVVNRNNEATGLSYDDIFIKRLFNSYIVKRDNPADLRIKDYVKDDLERLYEAERIKKALIDWEQDLWSY